MTSNPASRLFTATFSICFSACFLSPPTVFSQLEAANVPQLSRDWETMCHFVYMLLKQSLQLKSLFCVFLADECAVPVIQATCFPKQVKSLWSGSAFFGGRCRVNTSCSSTPWVLEVCWRWATTCSSAGRFTRSLAQCAIGRGQVRGDSSFKAARHWNYLLSMCCDYILQNKCMPQ